MRIVYFGWDEFAVPTLMKLANSTHEVVAVVTRPNEVTLNGVLLQASVAIQAKKHGFPILGHENVKTLELIEEVKDLKADLGIVAASGPELSEPLQISGSSYPIPTLKCLRYL